MSDNKEEKLVPPVVEEDDPRNKFYQTRGDAYARARLWFQVSCKTSYYMAKDEIDDDWFGTCTRAFCSHPDQRYRGNALNVIDMRQSFDNERSRYRNLHANAFLEKTNNVFVHVLFSRRLKANVDVNDIASITPDSMHVLIKRTLEKLFDAHNPDRETLD